MQRSVQAHRSANGWTQQVELQLPKGILFKYPRGGVEDVEGCPFIPAPSETAASRVWLSVVDYVQNGSPDVSYAIRPNWPERRRSYLSEQRHVYELRDVVCRYWSAEETPQICGNTALRLTIFGDDGNEYTAIFHTGYSAMTVFDEKRDSIGAYRMKSGFAEALTGFYSRHGLRHKISANPKMIKPVRHPYTMVPMVLDLRPKVEGAVRPEALNSISRSHYNDLVRCRNELNGSDNAKGQPRVIVEYECAA